MNDDDAQSPPFPWACKFLAVTPYRALTWFSTHVILISDIRCSESLGNLSESLATILLQSLLLNRKPESENKWQSIFAISDSCCPLNSSFSSAIFITKTSVRRKARCAIAWKTVFWEVPWKKKKDYINFGGKKVKVDFKNCTDYIINILLQSIFYFEIVNY